MKKSNDTTISKKSFAIAKKFFIVMILLTVLGFIGGPVLGSVGFFIGFIYLTFTMFQYVRYAQKFSRSVEMLYNEVSLNPSDEAVDKLKHFIEQNGCANAPNNWNRLRGVWVSINESPNVTTEKKKEIIQFLRLQGLTMYYKEAEVIDNYGK